MALTDYKTKTKGSYMKILIMFLICFGSFAIAQDAATIPAEVIAAPVDPSFVSSVSPAIETPPQWLVEALKLVYGLPTIGPILAKVMQWAGVLAVILTSLVAFLLGIVAILKPVANWAGLKNFAILLDEFKNSKIMYYLKYLSMFNAQKK